ncbi:cysteine-rich DPF motif domain-containing protein 1 isoform X1 [Pimephales promelas]|uniref:cysteine-rich DPF motif domain-containing protein 1 isoform X1 n=1 Tax=Pimephales promelas TaxID=90988 RepID=UPI0019555E67|nr:cysteine-rich DPF motif domain-containing protein 1 isoform X1 [Pimephales promelas]
MFSTQNSEVRLQFQEFLSLSGRQPEQRPFPGVVQSALSQPACSEVYRQAALSGLGVCIPPSQTASFSGFRACSSKDASKIVSCWPHKTLQVFKRSSREKLVELQAHDESGLFCIRRLLRPNERCLT